MARSGVSTEELTRMLKVANTIARELRKRRVSPMEEGEESEVGEKEEERREEP
jgi:hypothetical protein